MATWHQLKKPNKLYDEKEWTVVIDPPNATTALARFSSKNLAEVYMRGLRANNPQVAQHSYILRPGRV